MTLWHRAPRSVYQVYDEEQYFAGEDEPVVEDREQPAPSSHDPRSVRLLALGLLATVTLSVAGIVAVDALRRSHTTPAPAVSRRDPTRQARPVALSPPMPASGGERGSAVRTMTIATPVPVPAVSERPARRPAVVSPRCVGVPGRSGAYPLAAPIERTVAAADVASWHASESPPTDESQVDGEFGFER